MKKKLVKFLSIISSVLTFMFSCPISAYASFATDTTPSDYVFLMAFQACGISADNAISQWIAAYKGYLKSTNNISMLNQVNDYDKLNWGDTVTGIDTLYHSIKSWLSLSDSYGTDSRFYTLPSSPSPQLNKITAGQYSINDVPFDGINPMPLSGYDFLFSDLYTNTNNGRLVYYQRNVYKPSNVEVFGIVTGFRKGAIVTVKFYCKDDSSEEGYRLFNVSSLTSSYYYDDDTFISSSTSPSSWNWTTVDLLSVMNFPFKIFSNTDDAKNYVKTGVANNLFEKDKCSLWWYSGYNNSVDLQKSYALTIGKTMQLPESNESAFSAYYDFFRDICLDNATEKLSACGLEINFPDDYMVEHYQQNLDGNGWTKTDVENLTGVVGETATYTAKSYPGFTQDSSLTIPDDLRLSGDGSLIIKLYYNRNLINYVVNHYQQNVDGKSWTKVDADARSGLYGSTASYTAKSYPGFTYDASLTTNDTALTKSLVIDLYYNRNPISYTVEHYQGLTSLSNDTDWTLTDTDSLSGLYGTTALYTPKNYKGYTYNNHLTSSDNLTLSADGGLVIKLYYTKPLEVDQLEQSMAGVGNIISPASIVAIMIAVISFLGLLLLKFFRRTMRQASGVSK